MRVSEQILRTKCAAMGPEYRLDGAYGGWKVLKRSEHGGYEDIFRVGYVPKAALNDLINAYMRGHNDAIL